MPSVLRSVAAFAFVSAVAVMSVPGCSQQGEGQRCDSSANGDADCDDGLVCITQADLQENITDLCCHEDPANDSQSRCRRAGVVDNNGGSSGSSSAGSSAGGTAGGGAAGGANETEGGAAGTPGAGGATTMLPNDGGMSGAGGAPAITTEGGAAGAGTSSQGGAG